MGYSIQVGETRPLLTLGGDPIATASVTDPAGHGGPFNPGGVATILDDGHGNLVCTGNAVGSTTFDLRSGGEAAAHTVTVTAASPFDWTLGDPA